MRRYENWRQRGLAFKPAAPRRVHLLLAAMTWTVVGSVLATVGVTWVLGGAGAYRWWWLIGAAVVGLAKAAFVLRRTAKRLVARIMERGDGRCLGGFVSWGTWLLIGCMMGMGWVLRHGGLPSWIVGVVYAAIGTALATASLTTWRALGDPALSNDSQGMN